MNEVRISKSQIESYKIRGVEYGGWADIALDVNDKAGRISISSDFGNWAYYWGACGCSFKEFLCQLDKSYMAGKFGCGRFFDADATFKSWRYLVLERRKEDGIDAEEAREIWDSIESIDDETHDENGVIYLLQAEDHGKLFKFLEYMPDFQTTINPSFMNFWNRIWPHFVRQLKSEIEADLICA